MGCQF